MRLWRAIGVRQADAEKLEADAVTTGGDLAQLGVPRDVVEAVRDWHTSNWFSVAGAEAQRVHHEIGTRPGDPLADLLYAFFFARVSAEISARLGEEGLIEEVSAPAWGVFQKPSGQEDEQTHSIEPQAFMDDLVVPVAGPALELTARLARTAEICCEVCAEHGLELNFAEGKSEAIAAFRGPGRKQAIAQLTALPRVAGGRFVPQVGLRGGQQLRVVEAYRHLGTVAGARRHVRGGGGDQMRWIPRGAASHAQEGARRRPPRGQDEEPGRSGSLRRQALPRRRLLGRAGASGSAQAPRRTRGTLPGHRGPRA